jgi:predicted RNase H-like HicB family nuclease
MRVPFFCVAHGSDQGWEALCLDFDISVQGSSFEDVRHSLEDAVRTYVVDALKEDEPHRSRLLNRRAPLGIRLLWAARIFFATVLARRGRDRTAALEFPVSCPA